MKIIKKTNEKIRFQAEIEESLANAIRRYLNHIPVLAIDKLEISKNDSPLYDETMAHRTGLIPLKMSENTNKKKDQKLKLSVKKEGFVYSKELKGEIEVAYEEIPITYLEKGQELEFIATTALGEGNEHSKFSPGLMFYRNVFNIKIEKDCPSEVVEVCPKNILKLKEKGVVVEDSYKCDMCDACVELCEKKGKNSIKISPTKELIITLESFGQLTNEEMIKKSIDVLKKDLASIGKEIGK
jgi:DNA-directed RNA polymerase alpha subunit